MFDFAVAIFSTKWGNDLQLMMVVFWPNDGLWRWTRVKEAFLAPQNREEEEMSQSLPSSPNRLWQCQEVLFLNLLHQTVWLCLLLRRPHASRLWPERWSWAALHRIDGANPARHRPRDPEELRGPEAQPVRGVQQEDDPLGPEEVVQGELWRSTSRRWRRRSPTLVRWVPQEVGRVAEDEGLHRRGRPAPKRWSRWDSTNNYQLWSILASRQFWGGSSRSEEEDGPLASEGEVGRENWCPGHFPEIVFSWCLVIKHHLRQSSSNSMVQHHMKQGPSKDATSKSGFSPDVWSQGAVGANKIRARPAEQKKIEVPLCAPFSIHHHYHD